MRYLLSTLFLMAAALILPVPVAQCCHGNLQAAFPGANDGTPVDSPGTGFVTVILDTIAQTLQINASFSGLTSNTDSGAHPLLRATWHQRRRRHRADVPQFTRISPRR